MVIKKRGKEQKIEDGINMLYLAFLWIINISTQIYKCLNTNQHSVITHEERHMPRKKATAKKELVYRDEKGNTLYGFSQENLERTNRELRQTNNYLKILVIMVLILLGIFAASLIWADLNNVITAMIYK